jgi:thiol-disulfide isomerase/thioredoxin
MVTLISLRPAILLAIVCGLLPSSGLAAALNDTNGIPYLDSAGKNGYHNFLAADKHRAFAIAPGGGWSWKGGEDTAEMASEEALQSCRNNSMQACLLYALNDEVVFDAKAWARLWGPYPNRAQANRAQTGKERGNRFYNLAFTSDTGKSIKLSDLKGKVVLLHFWGSWCPPCQREMPELQQLHRALGASPDIRIVMLQVRENFATGRKWARQQNLNLPLFDSGVTNTAADSLTLAEGKAIHDRDIAAAFPTTYILDKHGIVVFSHVGPVAGWLQYLPLLGDVATRSGK